MPRGRLLKTVFWSDVLTLSREWSREVSFVRLCLGERLLTGAEGDWTHYGVKGSGSSSVLLQCGREEPGESHCHLCDILRKGARWFLVNMLYWHPLPCSPLAQWSATFLAPGTGFVGRFFRRWFQNDSRALYLYAAANLIGGGAQVVLWQWGMAVSADEAFLVCLPAFCSPALWLTS